MSLTALVASASLLFSPADYQVTNIQHQKPPIYAQAPKNLSTRLLKEADEIAKKRPISAIPLYERIIIDGGSDKEAAIEKLFDTHKKLIGAVLTGTGRYHEQSVIQNALNFYEKRKKDTDSTHLAKAYLHLGSLLWKWQAPIYFDKAIDVLNEAYNLGDIEIKAQAAWQLAFIYWNYASGVHGIQKYSMSDAKEQFQLVIQYAPDTKHAKRARDILQTGRFKKPK